MPPVRAMRKTAPAASNCEYGRSRHKPCKAAARYTKRRTGSEARSVYGNHARYSSEYLKKNYGELWNHQLIRTFRKNIGSANEIILGKDFPAEVGMNYIKFDVFSEENMEQMNKCYAELIKSYGGQNVL